MVNNWEPYIMIGILKTKKKKDLWIYTNLFIILWKLNSKMLFKLSKIKYENWKKVLRSEY